LVFWTCLTAGTRRPPVFWTYLR